MANYLYNGVELPELPDSTYAYANIRGFSDGTYQLTFTNKAGTYKNGNLFFPASTSYKNYPVVKAGAAAWGSSSGSGTWWDGSSQLFTFLWANYDVLNEDGTVYLAASDPVAPTVTGITLNQTAISLNRGETFRFSATVSGTGAYDTSVTYTLSGNSPNGGTALSADGLLTVGESETSPTLTVTAASVQNSAVSQSATVTVADFISKLKIFGSNTMTWNAADGYLETVTLEETAYKMFDEFLTYEQLESAVITAGAGPYTDTIPLAGQVTEFPYLPGFVQFMEFGLSITDELALEMGLPSGGIWLMYDLTTEGVETVSLAYSGDSISAAETTAEMIFSCSDLLETDEVYRIGAWVYPKTDHLDTTKNPTWISDLFAGPVHSESHTFTGLAPNTEYAVYAVIGTGYTATEHHATVTFTTAESTEPILVLSANQVTDRGFDLYITRQGLEAGGAYTAEIVIFRPDATGIPFEAVMPLTGNGVDYCAVTGLEPETAYIAEVAIHPASGGENVLFGELTVTTGEAEGFQFGFAGVEDVARRLSAACVGKSGTARVLTVFFGGRNGLAQSL